MVKTNGNLSDKRVRAAIYLRISYDRDMDGLAIERQQEDCEAICKQRGWTPIKPYYIDQSKSATDKTKVRPEYERMVDDYNRGLIDAIVCYDLDRLTRQPRQLEDWIDAAEDKGLLLVTANGDADLSTDGGRLYARVKAAVARAEVERKGARQHRAHQQRAEQGRPPHGVRPMGYRNDGSVIEDEAVAVKSIYDAFVAGASLKAISRALSGSTDPDLPNIPTMECRKRVLYRERNERRRENGLEEKPLPENRPWDPSSVLGILRNPRYASYSTYTPTEELKEGDRRRKWYEKIMRDEDGNPIKGTWEPIIDPATWERAQQILNDPERQSSRKGTDRKHLGSGLFICGVCGKPVRSHGKAYRCAGHILRKRNLIDELVVETIAARLSDPKLSNLLPKEDRPQEVAIRERIGECEARIMRAQADYDNEIIEAYDLKRIRDEKKVEIQKLQKELYQLGNSVVSELVNTDNPAEAFRDTDLARKRSIIDAFCTVKLYPHPRGMKGITKEDVVIEWKD